jgi:hypothetical protein
MSGKLNAQQLLAGSKQTHAVTIPTGLLSEDQSGVVEMRPLTVGDVQRVTQAARDQDVLSSLLMVQQALVEPALTVDQVAALPAGLAEFLLREVNRISGLSLSEGDLQDAVKAPLTRATFVLAREFGWTPAECAELTVGQVLLYLEMLAGKVADEEHVA